MDYRVHVVNERFNNVLIISLFLLLLMNTFARSQFELLTLFGQMTIDVTFIFAVILFLRTFIPRATFDVSLTSFYFVTLCMLALFFISFITSEYMESRHELIQVMLLF